MFSEALGWSMSYSSMSRLPCTFSSLVCVYAPSDCQTVLQFVQLFRIQFSRSLWNCRPWFLVQSLCTSSIVWSACSLSM
jgi:hypothetical protein